MAHEGYATTADGVRLFYTRVGDDRRPLIVPNGFGLIHDLAGWQGGSEDPPLRTLTEDPPLRTESVPMVARSVVAFDTRNRGKSDRVTDESKLERGIHHEVDDIEAVRRHLGAETIDLLGHSYLGLLVVLYAMAHPGRVRRIVQIGSVPPDGGRSYPRMPEDERLVDEVQASIRELQANPPSSNPEELCRSMWRMLSAIYVVNPGDASKLAGWERCHLENERAALSYVMRWIMPSVQRVALTSRDVRLVTMPVLTIHGERDRSAPLAGARDWVRLLPNARLVSVPGAGHMPWIEAPRDVFDSIERFLRQ